MKTILLPVSSSVATGFAQQQSLVLARRFMSHIQALYVRPLPPIVAGEGITVPGDYTTRVSEESLQLAQEAERNFSAAMEAAGAHAASRVNERKDVISFGWTTVEGIESQVVSDTGRSFDVVVIDRNRQPSEADWRAAAEAALFESGRPVLLAGNQPMDTIGEHVLIAWNGSTESARAIALAMPLLVTAKQVDIVSVEGAMVSGPSDAAIQAALDRHGIEAKTHQLSAAGGEAAGQAIVAQAQSIGADLIVKGAFTQSRLRQLIFGGATSHLLNESPLPVLFAH